MSKIKFDILNIKFQRRYLNKGFTMKENTGLDTETFEGYVKLICDDVGRFKEVNNLTDCINFLTHVRYRGKFNWFYNIQFDFESIIKYLDIVDLRELYMVNSINYDGYKITYLPKKYFAIEDSNNNRYHFYDMYNFLDVSLNKASKKFLNDEKINIIDANKLNTDKQYWIDNKEDIIKYCIKDAELTKRLADYFWKIIYEKLNFYPKSPMSKGKLSEEYFGHTCKIPTINSLNAKVVETAYNSFYGGRFELLRRGYFENCYCYDIKSAYPSQIANLPNFNAGKFVKVDKLNPDAYTGFYKCRVFSMEKNISPFKQTLSYGRNIYPNGGFIQFLTKTEIDQYERLFENSAISIEYGYEWQPKNLIYPFKSEIERLYQWKDSEKDEDIKFCVKIILNSLYGKFIQVSGDMNQTGKLFNPLYASLITSSCRAKLLNLAMQKPDTIISVSTDSVISTEPLNVPINPTMGDFQIDFNGQGVFIMSDVYNLWNEETQKVKSKLRGFSIASTKDYSNEETYLKDILNKMDSPIYEYFSNRPYHLGECLLHIKKRVITDINKFGVVKKKIDINGDNKRLWDKDFNCGKDCLKESHESKPLMV